MAARIVALCASALIAGARAEASLFSSISGGKRGAAAKKVVDVHGLGPTLDRYALALAATEPLRAARDRSVRRAIGRVRFFLLTGPRRCNACDPQCVGSRVGPRPPFESPRRPRRRAHAPPRRSNAWRSSCQQYAAGSSRVLDAFGFAPSEWNAVSRRLGSDKRLRRKVLDQAKIYALAATLDARRDAGVDEPLPALAAPPEGDDELVAFAALAQRVEALRQRQRADLVASLGVDSFPDYPICDSELLPLMSPKVRGTCAKFPAQAAALVKQSGVDFENFKALLEKAEKNPLFRWKLARAVNKLKQQQRKNAK